MLDFLVELSENELLLESDDLAIEATSVEIKLSSEQGYILTIAESKKLAPNLVLSRIKDEKIEGLSPRFAGSNS